MKTKPPENISTPFPTCGEVFHYLISALDLTAWADTFRANTQDKRRQPAEIKALSDQLRDWATEKEGRAPGRVDFVHFIGGQLSGVPQGDDLVFILSSLWNQVLDVHTTQVRESPTYPNREETRSWCAQSAAPGILFHLWMLQKLVRHLDRSNGPMLGAPLDELRGRLWPGGTATNRAPNHPLHATCYNHYADRLVEKTNSVDATTLAAWKSGEDRPSCSALGRHFESFPDKLGLLLNFAFAGLIEALALTLHSSIPAKDWSECRRMLLGQAGCMHVLDETVAKDVECMPGISLHGYERLLLERLENYLQLLSELQGSGLEPLDLRVAHFRLYEEYQRVLERQMPPKNFELFASRLDGIWQGTALRAPGLHCSEVETGLAELRTKYPDWSETFAGPMIALEARMKLCQEPVTSDSLTAAFELYQRAFAESRYRAGTYTAEVAQEALGLAALLHRREAGEGSIRPWINRALDWWDLLGLGREFDHEKLEQRIELAESRFTDGLSKELRTRLKAALPKLGLDHFGFSGIVGFVDKARFDQLQPTPVDRRQRKPMSDTLVGRDQTALMEAIDREQFELAREMVRRGDDLNFVNSTGDTCVTKAFARKDYGLVMEILLREHNPISRETVIRVTTKNRISGLEQALSEGQAEILGELARPSHQGREKIDMNTERIWEQTPLYYAVSLIAHYQKTDEEALECAKTGITKPALVELLDKWIKPVHKATAGQFNYARALECIKYLTNDLRVDPDVVNKGGNSALTYAAERGLLDVAAILLAAGANVNHRFQGSGTALVRAILNDDCEMARLLLEYRADYRLFVDPPLARRIYAMPMSERMRRLIPSSA